MGSSTKLHVRFLGGGWAPSWLPISSISEFRRQDTEEDRGKCYRVCPKWEVQHTEAMKAGLGILAKTKPKKTKNELLKECFPFREYSTRPQGLKMNQSEEMIVAQSSSITLEPDSNKESIRQKAFTGAQNKTRKTGRKNVSPKRVQVAMEEAQERNCRNKTERKYSKLNDSLLETPHKSAGTEKDGQSLVDSSLAGRKPTHLVVASGYKRNANWLDEATARIDHGIGENMYDLIKKRKYQQLKNQNKTSDCIGTIIDSVSETNKTPVTEEQEREQNEIPICSLSRCESNNDFGNLNNGSAIGSRLDLHEDLHNITSVLQNDDTHNNDDNDDIMDDIAAKDVVLNETRNISRNKTVANYDDSEENIEEIPRKEVVISAVNVSITRTLTAKINDNMIIQRIQEAYFPSYNFRF